MVMAEAPRQCSFCSKAESEVTYLLAGAAFACFICETCVGVVERSFASSSALREKTCSFCGVPSLVVEGLTAAIGEDCLSLCKAMLGEERSREAGT